MNHSVALFFVVLGSSMWMTPLPPGIFKEKSADEAKKVSVGKNVVLEVQGERRRVLVNAYVCLREGSLEFFLTRKRTREHEAILAAEIDARDVHTALYLARAKEGSPAQFRGGFIPATGTPIKIALEYEAAGKKARVPAQQWVRYIKTKKDLEHDWVFAGSRFILNPDDPTDVFYGANGGEIACLSNFDAALLDLPIESSSSGDELLFEAHTERIPPMETPVVVILEPVLRKQDKR